jgi:hypothetical protein
MLSGSPAPDVLGAFGVVVRVCARSGVAMAKTAIADVARMGFIMAFLVGLPWKETPYTKAGFPTAAQPLRPGTHRLYCR